ncbi:hypothetical protein MB84_28600 (plasmid) [Pandoraea oxalativorans]|uniref:Uncharacterized protein n=2 Tax=Pandoraea oxalativorans TaxID=573737 RepID=A0A0G3IC29_9BURK|nr:hypothetical protein MB84_28600 [Pandoraea oxalativorans]
MMAVRSLSNTGDFMSSLKFVHRGCAVDIEIRARTMLWDITIEITPFDGVELITPFGPRKLKWPRTQEFAVLQNALVDEVCEAIDRRLVGG